MNEIHIRSYSPLDLEATAELYFDSVRRGTTAHYTSEQREAWAPAIPELAGWRDRMSGLKTWIAEADGRIIGFMSLAPNGHLDLAFVHPDWIGKGVAAQLYRHLDAYARQSGLSVLTAEASLLARPFFERRGWQVLAEQMAERNGVALPKFSMKNIIKK